jgi:dTDP-4-amino-4,6-dideoxygalactose transaminase
VSVRSVVDHPPDASPTLSPADRPPRSTFLTFHLPEIADEDIAAVVDTLRSGWLTTGPKVRQFEAAFAQAIGTSHAVALNSATAALHLALVAIGLKAGDEVLVPTMTFAATAEVVTYFGAKPVLVDCEAGTLNIDPHHARQMVTSRCKAIIPVHFAGHPCEMRLLWDLARSHGLTIIEDAAHALPASYEGHRVGTLGDLACFSFYATKTITTGEGGMLTTNDAAYAARVRTMSLHGISRNAWNRYAADGTWYYEILSPGYKYNLTDIAAALGIEQLKKHRAFRDRRARIAKMYDDAFAACPELEVPARRGNVEHAWHLYVLRLNLARLTIGRSQFIEALKQERIGASVHFIPLHLHPLYRETYGYRPEHLPQATAAFERIVSLPIYPGMTDNDVQDVIAAVTRIVHRHRR